MSRHGIVDAVDTPPPAGLDEGALQRALAENWGLAAEALQYLQRGAGSFHWVANVAGRPSWFLTVDDLDTKPWIADHRDDAFDGLAGAYGVAWALEHRAGISFAVGPLRDQSGSVLLRLSGRHSLAVFPFVEGTAGDWGDTLEPAGRDGVIRQLARLHGAVVSAELGLARRPYVLVERPELSTALDDIENAWNCGPLSEPARLALAAHASDVITWLEELDALADHLRGGDADLVVTHGEPHPGNLIHTAAGTRLVDWDTVALGRPERDLWMLDDGSPGSLRRIEELTGHPVSEPAMRFYRLAWSLSDIASFVEKFRSPRHETDSLHLRLTALQRLLEGEPPAPYGR